MTMPLALPESSTRVIIVTNDGVMKIAAEERFDQHSNIQVGADLDALRTALARV